MAPCGWEVSTSISAGEGGADDDHVELQQDPTHPCAFQQFSDSLKDTVSDPRTPVRGFDGGQHEIRDVHAFVQLDKPDILVKITFRREEPYPGD